MDKNNISSFGGDPDRITLLGQSAGAMSVDVLLSSPLTRDMVSGAVMLSGAALQRVLSRPLSPQKMKKFWDEIIKNAGKTSLSELRDTDAKTLYYAWLKACRDEGIKSTLSYTLPCDDGKLLTKDTFNIKNNKRNAENTRRYNGRYDTDSFKAACEKVGAKR